MRHEVELGAAGAVQLIWMSRPFKKAGARMPDSLSRAWPLPNSATTLIQKVAARMPITNRHLSGITLPFFRMPVKASRTLLLVGAAQDTVAIFSLPPSFASWPE